MEKEVQRLPESKAAAIVKAGVDEFSRFTYSDANTERITAACGISKGLLFHYFGTKKEFYLHCLRYSLELLTKADVPIPKGDFYTVLFNSMEQRIRLCLEHPAETKILNLASREFSAEVRAEKDGLIAQYAGLIRSTSERVMAAAVSSLDLKGVDAAVAVQGLTVYTNALINRYLLVYQNTPDEFFSRRESIKKELRAYIDLMLYGICKEEK